MSFPLSEGNSNRHHSPEWWRFFRFQIVDSGQTRPLAFSPVENWCMSKGGVRDILFRWSNGTTGNKDTRKDFAK